MQQYDVLTIEAVNKTYVALVDSRSEYDKEGAYCIYVGDSYVPIHVTDGFFETLKADLAVKGIHKLIASCDPHDSEKCYHLNKEEVKVILEKCKNST